MITVGIDCGAKNTKAVVLKDGRIMGSGSGPTGFEPARSAAQSLAKAVDAAGISRNDIHAVGSTGSGREAITIANCPVSDIKAMARAARFFCPDARTVVDVGAEEARAARMDENGRPVDFALNDRCAAGAGAFIEAMARALEVELAQIGPLSLQSDKKISMNAQCVIFAESEVVGLIHARTTKPDISRAIHDAVAARVVSLTRRIGIHPPVVLIGGVGRNRGFAASLQRELQTDRLWIPDAPELGAAVGAALAAVEQA